MEAKDNKKYRNSKQRQRTLEILRSTDIHPTATWVYDQLKREFPSLSLGNVYRNLRILAEQGEILELKFGSTFDRFCGNITPHYHFVCQSCGGITDIDMPQAEELNKQVEKSTNYRVDHHRLEFYGSCSDCHDGQERSPRVVPF